MSDKFRFDDDFYPVPSAAVDADPVKVMEELVYRVGRLEQSLKEEQLQAFTDAKETMLEFLLLSDDIAHIIERWGVTTKASEAAIIRSVVALGKKLLAILDHHQVAPISTIGKPLDPETSEAVGTEVRNNLPANTVLREVQIGYMWTYGLLRRAQVIVSKCESQAQDDSESPDTALSPPDDNPPSDEALDDEPGGDVTVIPTGDSA